MDSNYKVTLKHIMNLRIYLGVSLDLFDMKKSMNTEKINKFFDIC